MAIVWTFDLIEGNTAVLNESGWQFERIGHATGVPGVGYEKLVNAVADTTDAPQIGDSHPDVATATLYEVQPISITATDIRCRFLYRDRWTDVNITVGATLIQEDTNVDRDGNAFRVGYTYPSDYEPNEEWRDKEVFKGGTLSKLIPQNTRVFNIREQFNPDALSRVYTGTVNGLPWGGDFARQWLCTGITGVSADGGLHWDNTYSFQFKVEGWFARVVFTDPNTGDPPDDIIQDLVPQDIPIGPPDHPDLAGLKVYPLYLETDFNDLELL